MKWKPKMNEQIMEGLEKSCVIFYSTGLFSHYTNQYISFFLFLLLLYWSFIALVSWCNHAFHYPSPLHNPFVPMFALPTYIISIFIKRSSHILRSFSFLLWLDSPLTLTRFYSFQPYFFFLVLCFISLLSFHTFVVPSHNFTFFISFYFLSLLLSIALSLSLYLSLSVSLILQSLLSFTPFHSFFFLRSVLFIFPFSPARVSFFMLSIFPSPHI